MIKFIDTNLFEDNANVHVIIYSDIQEKAKKKFDALVLGEHVLDLRESKYEHRAIVLKDNIRVIIKTMPLSSSSKGHRSQYSLVDRNIVSHPYGQDIFYSQIFPQTMLYDHLFKDLENTRLNEIQNIMLF